MKRQTILLVLSILSVVLLTNSSNLLAYEQNVPIHSIASLNSPSKSSQTNSELGCSPTPNSGQVTNPPLDVIIVLDASANGALFDGGSTRQDLLQLILAYLAADSLGRGPETFENLNSIGVLAYDSEIIPLTANNADSTSFEWKSVNPYLKGLDALQAPFILTTQPEPGNETTTTQALLMAYDKLAKHYDDTHTSHRPVIIYIGSLSDRYTNNQDDKRKLENQLVGTDNNDGFTSKWLGLLNARNDFRPDLYAFVPNNEPDANVSWVLDIWNTSFFTQVQDKYIAEYKEIPRGANLSQSVYETLQHYLPEVEDNIQPQLEISLADEHLPVSIGFLKSSAEINIIGRDEDSTFDFDAPSPYLTIFTIDPTTTPIAKFEIDKNSGDKVRLIKYRNSTEWRADISPRVVTAGIPVRLNFIPENVGQEEGVPQLEFVDEPDSNAAIQPNAMGGFSIKTDGLDVDKEYKIKVTFNSETAAPTSATSQTCIFKIVTSPEIAKVSISDNEPRPNEKIKLTVEVKNWQSDDELYLSSKLIPIQGSGVHESSDELLEPVLLKWSEETFDFTWPGTANPVSIELKLEGITADGLLVNHAYVLQINNSPEQESVVWWEKLYQTEIKPRLDRNLKDLVLWGLLSIVWVALAYLTGYLAERFQKRQFRYISPISNLMLAFGVIAHSFFVATRIWAPDEFQIYYELIRILGSFILLAATYLLGSTIQARALGYPAIPLLIGRKQGVGANTPAADTALEYKSRSIKLNAPSIIWFLLYFLFTIFHLLAIFFGTK